MFTAPEMLKEPENYGSGTGGGGSAAETANADPEYIGRIRVYFFEVAKTEPKGDAKEYYAPSAAKLKEGKKFFLASNTTRCVHCTLHLSQLADTAGIVFSSTPSSAQTIPNSIVSCR